MATYTRQPFAELGTPRLHALHSAKNRQNVLSSPTFASPLKPAPTPSTGKRQRMPDVFQDEADSENVDPALFNSPTKKTKFTDARAFAKPSRFSLTTLSPAKPLVATPAPSIRKALSSPNTARSTPINHTRGSPKHNRIGALSKRRASTSPFRRIDPPSFSKSPALPFSIDAALSGTLKNHTPKAPTPAPVPAPTPAPVQHVSTLDDSMPKSWFFAIHEDTPEQEAANLMEHSASVLDISTDDDFEAKKLNEELGKENIPPPGFLAAQSLSTVELSAPVESVAKARSKVAAAQDAMDEDRRPLGDLVPEDFYGEGCDRDTYVTVDVGMERPSGLSKECAFADEETSEQNVADSTPVVEKPEPTPSEPTLPEEASAVKALAPVSSTQDTPLLAPTQEPCSDEL